MLIPLTRKTFEQLVPAVATGAQYIYCWGKLSDVLRRVLISVMSLFAIILFRVLIARHGFDEILLITGIISGLYWIWGPVLSASLRNIECRRYGYCGFWRGEVLDAYLTEELIGTEETVNSRGDLVIVENRERCLNLEVGDEVGFLTSLRVPLKRNYRAIDVGDQAELLVFSNRGDLGRIVKTSDIYIPDHNLWVSDYPYVQREAFVEVSRRIDAQMYAEQPVEPDTKRRRTPRSERSSALARRDDYSPRDETAYEDVYQGAPPPDVQPPRRRRTPRRR